MCKPSCCPGSNGNGLGIAAAALVGLAALSAVARPVIHAADELLQIAVITSAVLVGLAIFTVVTVLVVRFRHTRRTAALTVRHTHLPANGRTLLAVTDAGPSRAELIQRLEAAEYTAHTALAALAHTHGAVYLPERKESGHAR